MIEAVHHHAAALQQWKQVKQQRSRTGRREASAGRWVVRAAEEGTTRRWPNGGCATVAHGLRRVCFEAIEEPHDAFHAGSGRQ